MDWTAIRDFVAVARAGSLSAAARLLDVSQPTIGRHIEQLEKELKAVLFNRTPQGLTLTETGSRILTNAQRMSDEANIIQRLAGGSSQRMEGSVRITLTDQMGNRWLPVKLAEFYRRFPNVQLEVVVENRSLNLIKREADIAIRFSRPQQLDLVARRSISLHYGLYVSNEYIERYGQPMNAREFKKHHFISYDETIFNNAYLKRLERLVGHSQILYRSTNNAGILEAVIQGIGMGFTSCYFSDQEPGLIRLFPDKFDFAFSVWVVTHANIYKSASIRAVFDFLCEKLEEDAELFAGKDIT